MTSLYKLTITLAVLALVACSQRKERSPEPAAKPVTTPAMDTRATLPPDPAPTNALTGDEMVKWYEQCWKLWNQDWARTEACYDDSIVSEEPGSGTPPWRGKAAVMGHIELFKHVFPDAKGEVQLVLVSGKQVVGIVLVTGTHAGAMKRPGGEIAPTGKQLSIYLAHLQEIGDSGKSVSELIFLDHAALWGQLGLFPGPHRAAARSGWEQQSIVVAKDDDTERSNVEAYKQRLERFNARDAQAMAAGFADDLVWSDLALPGDLDKKAAIGFFEAMWKGFSDLQLSAPSPWAAGEYVVAVGMMEGTNDGDVPALKLDKTGKRLSLPYLEVARFRKGKLVASWLFYDGLGLAGQLGLGPTGGGGPGKGKASTASPPR